MKNFSENEQSEFASDLGYNKNMPCRHVYEIVGSDICPDCGGYTHETNFSEISKLHRQHILDGKDKPYKCEICGGTIRGWWDI